MKIKRSTGLPSVLLLYLIVMGVYAWPERNPEVTYTQWSSIIAITLACIVILHFLLKKREKNKKEKE